ncbi:type III secretion system export apparatus subunit SctU [Massilia oculi]|jgi:type III secretion protein U
MSEKTEKPTEKSLQDAREKGTVAVSRDLARVMPLALLGELAFAFEGQGRAAVQGLMELALSRIGTPFAHAQGELATEAFSLLLPVFAVCLVAIAVAAVAGYWGQFGILIAPGVLTPSIDKLNPANGIKQLFSMRKVAEACISLIKVSLVGLVTWVLIRDALPTLVSFAGGTPASIHEGLVTLMRAQFRTLVGICLVLALIDYAVQRHFTIKSLMMSMEDIKREYKNSEGDPQVKGQRRQLAHELAGTPAEDSTAQADAVVVNPTHFAVAMRYDAAATPVPLVLAKGRDEVAQAMIRRAHALGIPVIRHVWLARTLYATGRAARPVPRATYAAVAHVYAVIAELGQDGAHSGPVDLETTGLAPD